MKIIVINLIYCIFFIDKLFDETFNYSKGLSVRYVNLTSVDKQQQGIV